METTFAAPRDGAGTPSLAAGGPIALSLEETETVGGGIEPITVGILIGLAAGAAIGAAGTYFVMSH